MLATAIAHITPKTPQHGGTHAFRWENATKPGAIQDADRLVPNDWLLGEFTPIVTSVHTLQTFVRDEGPWVWVPGRTRNPSSDETNSS